MKKQLILILIALAFGTRFFAQTESASTHQHAVIDPDKLTWMDAPPGLPAGVKIAVLAGNPGEKGPFTIRLRAPDGYKIPPHTHPTAENLTVISGTFNIGMGEKFDEKATQKLSVGGFASMSAGMQHFAWVKGETIVQVQSEGPFVINYVNPADDPRNAKK